MIDLASYDYNIGKTHFTHERVLPTHSLSNSPSIVTIFTFLGDLAQMNKNEYINVFNNESTHYYYVDTHRVVCSLVARYALHRLYRPHILDAGCGTGLLGIKLRKYGDVTGIDNHALALRYSKKRGLRTRRGSIERLPFKDGSFDIITSVDVLYHKEVIDDEQALREFYRVLKPGGIVVLRVPAVSWLLRRHDAYVYTKRRYDKRSFRQKLLKAGFSVQELSYVHLILFMLAGVMFLYERIDRRTHDSSNVFSLSKPLNDMMCIALQLEYFVSRHVSFPIGLGLVAVAIK